MNIPKYKKLKDKLSDINTKRINARWGRYRAEQPERKPDKWQKWPKAKPMRTVIVRDHFTEVTHTLQLYKGDSRDSFNIDVDGSFWTVGGWSRALEKVRKSCVRIARNTD